MHELKRKLWIFQIDNFLDISQLAIKLLILCYHCIFTLTLELGYDEVGMKD